MAAWSKSVPMFLIQERQMLRFQVRIPLEACLYGTIMDQKGTFWSCLAKQNKNFSFLSPFPKYCLVTQVTSIARSIKDCLINDDDEHPGLGGNLNLDTPE